MVLVARRPKLRHGIAFRRRSHVRPILHLALHRTLQLTVIHSIFWPFDADQPANAALVSIIHEAGYELVEARQGIALQPMHRLNGRTPEGSVEALRKEAIEILAKARGEDGKVRRMNAQRLGKQFADYWAPDGDGWKELQRITDVLH